MICTSLPSKIPWEWALPSPGTPAGKAAGDGSGTWVPSIHMEALD